MSEQPDRPRRGDKSDHFFHREPDGSTRFRVRLPEDLATLVEEAAGDTSLMVFVQRCLRSQSEYTLRRRAEEAKRAAREAE